jgi:hypothetical protein
MTKKALYSLSFLKGTLNGVANFLRDGLGFVVVLVSSVDSSQGGLWFGLSGLESTENGICHLT